MKKKKKTDNEKKRIRMNKLRSIRRNEMNRKCERNGKHDIVEILNQNDRIKKGRNERNEVEECSCDYDIDCKYCNNLSDEDKNLTALAEHTWTQEEERQFEEKEMNEYRENKRIERNKKRKEKSEDLRKPAPPLPERELCLYEKIRGDIIEKREKEWKIYEKEWEKKEKGNK